MRILLIKPETVGIFSFTNLVDHEPLELEYIYTVLCSMGCKAVIYDRRYDLTSLKRKLRQIRPHIVCITGYITQQKLMIRYCDVIKDFDCRIKIILGGSNVELNYENYFRSKADYLYHLSGLSNFAELVRRIGKGAPVDDVKGICYRKDGKWKVNPKVIESPESLPVPDRTYFYRNKEKFRYLCFRPLALVKNSFSCPRQCSFCFCTNRNSGRYACRSVESLVDEIASLKVPAIHITDDDFLISREYLTEFVRLIRERGINKKFLIYGRADFIAHNEDIIKELASIGLSLVMVGLESPDNDELDSYNKHTTSDDNLECVRILHENGIYCAGLFIVHQGMTKADFRKLYRWIADKDIIPTVSVFTPMQGSAMYGEYEDKLLTRDVTKQDLFHCILPPEHMSLRNFTLQYYKLSLKLAWKNRHSGLYKDNQYFRSSLFIIKVLLVELKRLFSF